MTNQSHTNYFVDEAGDTTLFGRHGKVLVGTEAVSRFFMVARLEVADIVALQSDMDALRTELLADPLLKTLPSMQVAAGKTALFFHAKDDVAEVRHAVFKLLLKHEMTLTAVVKEKHHLLADVRGHEAADPKYRYKSDGHEIYDDLIARLFEHERVPDQPCDVTFAVRGSKPRTAALKAVLDSVEKNFSAISNAKQHDRISVISSYPAKTAGLQACDYLLWALQRFYERHEERYLQALWTKFAWVLDLDAPTPKTGGIAPQTGVAFNEKHPLTLVSRAGVWNGG
jgi:Protein of unknown function (DUF3800)